MECTKTLFDTAPRVAVEAAGSPQHVHRTLSNIPHDIFIIIVFLLWDRGPRDHHFPTTASHVCRTWRYYALGTPSFWSTLRFIQFDPERTIQKYKTWLTRTLPDFPLDITIGQRPFQAASVKHAKAIMRLIMPHVGRWRSLQVDPVPVKILRFIFDRWGSAGAPMLEVLKVFGKGVWSTGAELRSSKWRMKLSIKTQAPCLRELDIRALPLSDLAEGFNTRLQVLRLTHPNLRIAGADANVNLVHLILKNHRKLRALSISSDIYIYASAFKTRIPVTPEQPLSRVSHSALTEITVHLPSAYQTRILESLDLPNLWYILTPERLEEPQPLVLLPIISRHRPFPNLVSLHLQPNNIIDDGGGYRRDPLNKKYLDDLEGGLQGLLNLRALTFTQVDLDGGWPLLCLGGLALRLND
ncbi:hypothetical protein FRB90_006662 [Tulasnella sp. 427]|nr:hypothetical protein FRB90_006662 [Tulasnella sp. 427]